MLLQRGPRPKKIISEKWTPNLAYAVGLLATDGCLSRYGHIIDLTSKDKEQLVNYCRCLGIKRKIGKKKNGQGQISLRVQFRSVIFYDFLTRAGLTPAKSKTLGVINLPKKYFFDFLRGAFDGDGTTYSYWDPRWRSSFMFYLVFVSASKIHIDWLRSELKERLGVVGHLNANGNKRVIQLKYAKRESFKIIKRMYYSDTVMHLSRKRLKIDRMLAIVGEKL